MNKTRNTNLLTKLIFATLVLSACSLGGCRMVRGSGDVVEETRKVSGVTGVNLATFGHLTIAMGDTESLRIEAVRRTQSAIVLARRTECSIWN